MLGEAKATPDLRCMPIGQEVTLRNASSALPVSKDTSTGPVASSLTRAALSLQGQDGALTEGP